MFKILDGREAFFQWDLDQKLIVEDASINEVHFSNHGDDDALVVEVVDGMVDVPNIMLQENWRLKVYAYSVDHTKVEQVFNVQKRAKPSDYVYTETEIKDYDDLVARIDEIELNGVSQEAIERAVEIYLDANPVEPGATTEEAAQIEQNKQDIQSIEDALSNYALKEEIPDTSGLATETYVDEAIAGIDIPDTDLSDYYTKSETDQKIADAAVGGEVDLSSYATKKYVDDAVAAIDVPETDLSNYVQKTDIASNTALGLVKTLASGASYGVNINSSGVLSTVGANATDIAAKTHGYKPLTPNNLDYIMEVGLTTNARVLSAEKQTAAKNWLGIQDGQVGPQGPQGEPGADYVLTDADKNEIALLVIDTIPNCEQEVY